MTYIKGDNDYYLLIWTERAEPSSTPIPIDTAKWLERFKALAPIRLCPIVPGEAAPYASCLDKIASDAREALAHAKELLNQKRFSEAVALFEEAGASGNTEGQVYAGEAYLKGVGVTQDYNRARQWYENAAAKGDATASNVLGLLYFNGQGGPQDEAQARSLFEKAAAAGRADAMYNFGFALQRAQDYAQARQWFEKAAAAGNAGAMDNLCSLYEKGFGVAQDFGQAREWCRKAVAAGGYPLANDHLAHLPQ